jgi:hypothetical protein
LKGVQDETAALLSVLKRHRVPAIGFVNGDKLDGEGPVEARVALPGRPRWRHPAALRREPDAPAWIVRLVQSPERP